MISRTNLLITYHFCSILYHHTSSYSTTSNYPPAPLHVPKKNLTLINSEPLPPPAHPHHPQKSAASYTSSLSTSDDRQTTA
ncbi:hypothetical protein HanRHA438_Chr09g0382481 [Helianthus annuus]|uniref:Uncharacterized protein n=1 Tax=Helianthus annuus TaxID=4232 RepID=A0A251TTJ1_HELAN|nr:hypothetical protein HanXRQr2_Chr09g0370831 [Helianthus annuus]KAJ0541132.1 hypothetical protein HanHA89_Chr09g0325011 [Helianthus annuus]KAJ0706215.1 hypothetical protein HanLR1_Chr09g0304521 [Helianthus annuus]KAJ0710303.1 hypothetical protein HanOQP8_Chr09g0310861 [Helianthus annuus]KAJ0886700.1 hypothetical protein HanRHA438_Chr09g0382481 [Helianthus annuus]